MRNGKHTLFTVLFILLFTAIAGGQETTGRMNLAEERISVSASSATVLQWFNKIEREAHITLSYNPSHIDLGKVCRITTSGTISIGQLLDKLLEGYTFKTTVIPHASWPSK